MSTYDAYNLSLRDSTEFTVPTGGSGGDSQFDIVDISVDFINYDGVGLLVGPLFTEMDEGNGNNKYAFGTMGNENAHQDLQVIIPHDGVSILQAWSFVNSFSSVSVTGDIEVTNADSAFIVQGPGTITITQNDNS